MKFGEVARFVKSGSSSSRQEIFVEAWDCHTIGMGGNRINRVTEIIKTWENEDQRDRIGKMSELGQKKTNNISDPLRFLPCGILQECGKFI